MDRSTWLERASYAWLNRRVIRLPAAAVAVACTVVLLPRGPSASADGWPCGVPGARLVRESRTAIVAKVTHRSGETTARYYACLRSTERPLVVAEEIESKAGDTVEVREDSIRVTSARGGRGRSRISALPMSWR